MTRLIDSILDGNYIQANELFEERMEQIAEKKLYENKRMMQTEVVKPVKGKPGEFTGQNTPADWAKYRKAHPALGMYDTPSSKGKKPESKVAKQRKAGYVKAEPALKALEFIKRVRKYKETGKLDEATVVQQAQQHAAAIERMGKPPKPEKPEATPKKPKVPEPVTSTERRAAAWRSAGEQRKSAAAEKATADRLQKVTNRLATRSLKNIVKGKDIRKNIGTLAKHAGQTTVGKAVTGAVKGTVRTAGKALRGAASGIPDMMPEETTHTPRKIKVKKISRNISKNREAITVRRKGDRSMVKLRIPKDKYNPRIHNLV